MNMFGHETAEETRAAEQAAREAQNAEILAGAWIVTTHHQHCKECNDQIENAVSHAKVTGSVGCTYNVQGVDGVEHGAHVTRETYEERRKALGMA